MFELVQSSGHVSEVDWTTGIADSGRISIERMIADQEVGRGQISRGVLRLDGAGVTRHAAGVTEVSNVIASFQRLVTAVGSAVAGGNRSLRGQIATGIAQRTRLLLVASPAPGSLVLNLSPASPPENESAPAGAVPLFQEAKPLADEALALIVSIMERANSLGPDVDDSELLQEVEGLGPRTGSSLRSFAAAVAEGAFNVDVGWRIPTERGMRAGLDQDHARALVQLVESRNLDAEQFEVVGVLRTVSDVSAWVIDGEDGERYQVDGSGVALEISNQLHIHSRVRVMTDMVPTRHVGGSYRYSYTARSVEVLG